MMVELIAMVIGVTCSIAGALHVLWPMERIQYSTSPRSCKLPMTGTRRGTHEKNLSLDQEVTNH